MEKRKVQLMMDKRGPHAYGEESLKRRDQYGSHLSVIAEPETAHPYFRCPLCNKKTMSRKECELATSDWLQSAELLAHRQLLCEKEVREAIVRVGDPWILEEFEEDDRTREAERQKLHLARRRTGRNGEVSLHRGDIPRMLAALTEQEHSLAMRLNFSAEQHQEHAPYAANADAIRFRSAQEVGQPRHQRGAASSAAPSAVVATASELYQQFLIRHRGLSLGWEDADHNTFLALVARGCGQRDVLEGMRQRCPYLSTEDVMSHVTLYEEFQRLLHNKRIELDAFRAQREEDERHDAAARAAQKQQQMLEVCRDEAVAEQRRVKHALELKARLEALRKAKQQQQATATTSMGPSTHRDPNAGQLAKEEAARALRDRTNNEIEAYLAKKSMLAQKQQHREGGDEHIERHDTVHSNVVEKSMLRRRWEDDKRKAEMRSVKIAAHSQQVEIKTSRLLEAASKLAPHIQPSFDRLTHATASSRARSALNREPESTSLFPTPVGHKAKVAWCGPSYLR